MNLLTQIPAPIRKLIYSGYALAILIVGSIQAAYESMEDTQTPGWLKIALAVLAYLGVPLGLTAASNVSPKSVTEGDGFPDYDETQVGALIEDAHGVPDPLPGLEGHGRVELIVAIVTLAIVALIFFGFGADLNNPR